MFCLPVTVAKNNLHHRRLLLMLFHSPVMCLVVRNLKEYLR